MLKFLKILLWPFALLYGAIMRLRNIFYNNGVFRSTEFSIPVLSVGNLTVGGTGKTPHVEYLIRLLQEYKIATLSRGYKRQSTGFLLAGDGASAAELGDEPFQYHLDFPEISVAVSEDRVAGVYQLLEAEPHLQLVILDDAMQHRAVKPSLNLLLTDYGRLFHEDYVLPMGLLREPRSGAKRADAIVVSKCPPQLGEAKAALIAQRVKHYSRSGTPVFFSSFAYGQPKAIGSAGSAATAVVLLTGIANPKPLVAYLAAAGYQIKQHLVYPDHYRYTPEDLQKLKSVLEQPENQHTAVFTTRKDAAKLLDGELKPLTQLLPVFYVPIEVDFLWEKGKFDAFVLGHVSNYAK